MYTQNLPLDYNKIEEGLMLVKITPAYKYVNGVKTDVLDGYKYHLIAPGCNYDTLQVKITGDARLANPDKPIPVKVINLKVRVYVLNGRIGVAATADNIVAVGVATHAATTPK